MTWAIATPLPHSNFRRWLAGHPCITMFALAGSSVLSIAEMGTTIGVGLLFDTLVVRTFVLPLLIALLGRWFWWPSSKTIRALAIAPVRDQSRLPATLLR